MTRHFTDYRAYSAALKRMGKELFPKAMAETINMTGRAVHNRSIRNAQSMLTIRSDWPIKSIRFSPAKVRSSGAVGYAVTGSIWDPMRMHNQGGTVRAHRRRIAIVTTWTREGETKKGISLKRYRLHRLGEVRGLRKGQSVSIGQRYNKRKRKWGQPFIANMRKLGIYQRVGSRLFMVRDLSVKSYRLKRRPWHTNAVRDLGKRSVMEQVFIREAKKQLGRIR